MSKTCRMFRLLRADEIECRVQKCNENGVSVLLYKDARCDMNILDETVGAMNWKKSYQLIDGQLFCTLEVWDREKQQWIGKQDVGVESNTEAEKGRASDAQKRSAVAFGIGRELYTAPFIWIKASDTKLEEYDDNGRKKYKCKDAFMVRAIEYENDCISYLLICNKRGEIVYQYGISEANATPRMKLIAYCKSAGLDLNDIAAKYNLDKGTDDARYNEVLEELKNVSK